MNEQQPVNLTVNQAQPEASIRVSLTDIYAEMKTQGKAITDLGSKLDRVLERQDDAHRTDSDHETRLRVVEKTYVTKGTAAFWLTTAIAALIALGGLWSALSR